LTKHSLNISDYKDIAKVLSGLSGVDFSNFALSFARKRLENTINEHGINSISEFKNKLVSDKFFLETVIYKMLPPVSELFRAPEFWLLLQSEILPKIAKKSVPRICVPQCSSGEELFSILIILERAKLLDKVEVTAYDSSERNIKNIKKGVYSIKKMTQAKKNFAVYAPDENIEQYCTINENSFTINPSLLKKVDLQVKNLLDDNTGEYDLILFRNSLIYSNRTLHNKMLSHLQLRMPRGGFLAIGSKETISGNSDLKFAKTCKTENIFKKGRF